MASTDGTQDAAPVQAFELRMDNPEDQDELNRRLRKPEAQVMPANGPASAPRHDPQERDTPT